MIVRIVLSSDHGSGWVRHLKDAGFAVTVEETTDLRPVRKRLGVPADLAACHTAEVDGYVLEGHVPAAAVRRLLEKRPTAIGLAVPGMPAGNGRGNTPAVPKSFSSERLADSPLCTLLVRKVSGEALGRKLTICVFSAFSAGD